MVGALPPNVQAPLWERGSLEELLEVVLDLGRLPEARFPELEAVIAPLNVTEADIQHVVERIGALATTIAPALSGLCTASPPFATAAAR